MLVARPCCCWCGGSLLLRAWFCTAPSPEDTGPAPTPGPRVHAAAGAVVCAGFRLGFCCPPPYTHIAQKSESCTPRTTPQLPSSDCLLPTPCHPLVVPPMSTHPQSTHLWLPAAVVCVLGKLPLPAGGQLHTLTGQLTLDLALSIPAGGTQHSTAQHGTCQHTECRKQRHVACGSYAQMHQSGDQQSTSQHGAAHVNQRGTRDRGMSLRPVWGVC
jgi:hypothetical protein